MSTLSLKSFDKSHNLYEKVTSYGMPNTKTEQYRNFPIKSILKREYIFQNQQCTQGKEGTKLLIENGSIREYPRGVKISFDKAFAVDEEHFDVLYFASHILSELVISIEISEDIEFDIEHIFSQKEILLTYRLAIKVLPNIQVSIFESFRMKNSENSFFLYGLDISVGENTTMVWIRSENRGEKETSLIGTHSIYVAKQAILELKTFDYGSANSLHIYKIDLQNYALLDAGHLLLASAYAKRGNVVQINHKQEYSKSIQEARSILQDNATGIFDAKICVERGAPYSNASQNSKAILLTEHARMYAKPQLEIYIDELHASHGSSIGTLNEEALFYLCSRGIRMDTARSILVLAFANCLIDTLKNKVQKEKIHIAFELLLQKDLL